MTLHRAAQDAIVPTLTVATPPHRGFRLMRSVACFANVTFALAFTLQSCGRVESPRVPEAQRAPAPDIAGEDLDGVSFCLNDYRGKIVILDFWGDW